MNLVLSDEQEMFRDSVQRFVRAQYSFEFRNRRLSGQEDAKAIWSKIAELGWFGLGIAEEHGGLGGGMVEQAIIQEEFGRGLVVEPYLNAVIFAAHLLQKSPAAYAQQFLGPIAAGETQFAVCWAEVAGRYDPENVQTRATATADGFRLSGCKLLVMGGGSADWLIVSATLDDGIGLFIVPGDHAGVTRRSYVGFEGVDYADIAFDAVDLSRDAMIADGQSGLEYLEEALDHARVGLCAALVGAMSISVELTTDYVKTRRQFGKALADFQIVQHRLVDMLIDTEQSRSILLSGIAGLVRDPAERRYAVSSCMVAVLEAVRKVTGAAVHQHGGIGMTRELAIGHYYRFSLIADKLLGDVDYHMARCIDATLQHDGRRENTVR